MLRKEIMFKFKILCSVILLSLNLYSTTIDIQDDTNNTSIKNDVVKFAIELGTKTNFWSPGLSGNVIDYDTEGLFLGYGRLKLKLYDSDIFSIEKYGTFSSSNKQDDLLKSYKNDQKHDSTIDGVRISVQLIKIMNYLFEKEWLNGFNYEFNTRNFIGDATLKMNSAYWYGKINNATLGEDFSLLERGDKLSFKTKFTSHKLSYQWNNILNNAKGSYASIGLFDEEWSKPTFIGDTALRGELPVIFDANYYSKGLATAVGINNNGYNIKAYVDMGLDNEMKIIQKGENYSTLNKNVDMYMMGISADYRFSDVYSTNSFTTDIILGAEMQYNQIVQDGTIELDAETLYGVNAGIEIIF